MKITRTLLIASLFAATLQVNAEGKQFLYQTSFESPKEQKSFNSQETLEKYLHGFGYLSQFLTLSASFPLPTGSTEMMYTIPTDAIQFKPIPSKQPITYSAQYILQPSQSLPDTLKAACSCKYEQGCISTSTQSTGSWKFVYVSNPATAQGMQHLLRTTHDYQCTYQFKTSKSTSIIHVNKDQYYDCTPPKPDYLPDFKGKTSFLYQLAHKDSSLFCTGGALSAIAMKTPINAEDTNQSCSSVADPIDTSSGTVFEKKIDYISPLDHTFKVERFYNSNLRQWQFYYSQHISQSPPYVTITRPNGDTYKFINTGHSFTPVGNLAGSLEYVDKTKTTIKYTLPSGKIEFYNTTSGALSKIIDRQGHAIIFAPSLNKGSATNFLGQKLIFSSLNGKLTSAELPNGQSIKYTYTGPYLTKVTYPNGSSISYQYSDNPNQLGLLIAAYDSNHRKVSSWTYSNSNQAISNNQLQ
ncbi:DUF6531 domain-containing protein [Piscirickettsia litoralis]|uniref:DUF6531 domain-containing protein n=1 Tax=Piscirickettsia litoralis TaxID=1891921 RepID=A0ABX2ZYY4_9GAMM|nr:DUF6531 domain-containing protein [Piscirickettsia litoralis]ODN41415.1 hypothetical protein BGC07_16765 [Piscirickettsia litoralis]